MPKSEGAVEGNGGVVGRGEEAAELVRGAEQQTSGAVAPDGDERPQQRGSGEGDGNRLREGQVTEQRATPEDNA